MAHCNRGSNGRPGEGGGEGESQHVRGSVLLPIPAIEGAHAPIGNQQQAKLRVVSSRGRQDGLGCPAQPHPIERHYALPVLQDDGHGDQGTRRDVFGRELFSEWRS